MKQGSVLSMALFLLSELQSSGCGLSINSFYCDDIRTLATSQDSLKMQVSLVNDFANDNFLKLNIEKCEICGITNWRYFIVKSMDLLYIPVNTSANVWAIGG